MASSIKRAHRGKEIVWLADVQRGEKRLQCCVCEGRLSVRDGKGERASGKGRRSVAKGKHFAHVGKGGCYGEGMVHSQLKTLFTNVINRQNRFPNKFMGISYVCPSSDYAINCMMKVAPGRFLSDPELPQLERGYHSFDLLKDLYEAKSEHWLGGRKTRADIAGLDQDGNPLWVIEIKRTGVSDKAIEYAKDYGIPLFVIAVKGLPKSDDDAELPLESSASNKFWALLVDARGSHLPRAVESYNTVCEREKTGMGPTDTFWNRLFAHVCPRDINCESDECDDHKEVLLHQCGGSEPEAKLCPDTAYIWKHGITWYEMYTYPEHKIHSHINN